MFKATNDVTSPLTSSPRGWVLQRTHYVSAGISNSAKTPTLYRDYKLYSEDKQFATTQPHSNPSDVETERHQDYYRS